MEPKLTEQLTLILPVNELGFDFSKIEPMAFKNGMQKKKEFHITIIGYKSAKIIEATLLKDESSVEKILRSFVDIINSTDWSYKPLEEFYTISKNYSFIDHHTKQRINETRTAIIQMIILECITDFYEKLNTLLGLNLESPIPHVTLFTKSTHLPNMFEGIGIYSKEEFEKLKPQKI